MRENKGVADLKHELNCNTNIEIFGLRQRRLIQPAFHQQRINAYAETMVHYTKDLLMTWKDGEIRDIHEDMINLTLNIVTKTII